jgi:[ribosomal protein S5]-alanine N-acetyltransferase
LQQFPQLETQHFRLRQLRVSDAPALFAYFSDDDVVKYYDPNFSALTDIQQALEFIEHTHQAFSQGNGFRWGISLKDTDTVIGTIGYHSWVKSFFKAEIGYEISRTYWRQGVVTEAIRPVLAFGFQQLQLNRIEAFCDEENVGSYRVLEKSGFTREGTMRDSCVMNGSYRDTRIYALLAREFVG